MRIEKRQDYTHDKKPYYAAKGPMGLIAYGKTEDESIARLKEMTLIWMELAEPKLLQMRDILSIPLQMRLEKTTPHWHQTRADDTGYDPGYRFECDGKMCPGPPYFTSSEVSPELKQKYKEAAEDWGDQTT